MQCAAFMCERLLVLECLVQHGDHDDDHNGDNENAEVTGAHNRQGSKKFIKMHN